MSLWLHGFVPGGDGRDDTVFCIHVDRCEMRSMSIPVDSHHLVTTSRFNPRGTQKLKRPYSSAFELKPGSLFWLVDNDPKQVQAPNGPIVWRWPSKDGSQQPFPVPRVSDG